MQIKLGDNVNTPDAKAISERIRPLGIYIKLAQYSTKAKKSTVRRYANGTVGPSSENGAAEVLSTYLVSRYLLARGLRFPGDQLIVCILLAMYVATA